MQLPESLADTFCEGDPRKEEKLAGSVSSGAAISDGVLGTSLEPTRSPCGCLMQKSRLKIHPQTLKPFFEHDDRSDTVLPCEVYLGLTVSGNIQDS